MSNMTPKTIFFTWDIQYQCNYNCTYCFLHFEKSSAQIAAAHLKTDEWVKIWEDIYHKYGECEIQVTGGEPFCYPDFIDLIFSLSKRHMFSFSTNLSWDVDKFISKVSPLRAKIDTSFHSEFIKIKQFIEKFQKLKKNGYLVSVTMVAYPALLEKIYDFGKEFGDNGIKLVVYPYRGPYQGRNYPEGYTKEEAVLLQKLNLQIGENVSKKLNIKHLFNSNTEAVKQEDPIDIEKNNSLPPGINIEKPYVEKLCLMGHRYAKILPNGDAFRCCTAIWDETKGFDNWGSLGNLVKGTFRLDNEPRVCHSSDICACYKAMVVGEEKSWLKDWDNIAQIKENFEIRENLDRIKKIRDERKPDEAVRLLQDLLVRQSYSSRIHTLLAEIYVEQGNLSEAERAVELALKVNIDLDDLSWSYRVFGKIYVRLAFYTIAAEEKKSKASLAFDYFSKAIQTAVNSNSLLDQSEAYYEQANAYYLLNEIDKALESIELAIQHNSQKEFLKAKKQRWIIDREISSVMVLKYRGQLDETIARVQELLIEYPGNLKLITLWSEIQLDQGNFIEAERQLKIGLENNPDSDDLFWPYIIMGRIQGKKMLSLDNPKQRKLNFSSAIAYLTKADAMAGERKNVYNRSQIHDEMAQLYLLLNDFDNAIKHIDFAIEYAPQNELLKDKKWIWKRDRELNAIKQLKDRQLLDEAVQKIQSMLAEYPYEQKALILLAEIYIEQGKLEEAERLMKECLKNNPALDNLSWMFRVMGKINCSLAFRMKDAAERETKLSLAFEYFSEAVKKAIVAKNAVDQSQACYESANLYYKTGNFDRAIENIDSAIQYHPENEFLKQERETWMLNGKPSHK